MKFLDLKEMPTSYDGFSFKNESDVKGNGTIGTRMSFFIPKTMENSEVVKMLYNVIRQFQSFVDNERLEMFITEAQKVYGNKYDYSLVKFPYISTEKIPIICPKHGLFYQTIDKHLTGFGCPKCFYTENINKKMNTEEFIAKAREVHGDKYDYSKVEYVNNMSKVCIICPEHGEFWQKPASHLIGRGCPICCKRKQTMNTEEFIARAREVHGNKYDYSKVIE
jgi:hypothetical protein